MATAGKPTPIRNPGGLIRHIPVTTLLPAIWCAHAWAQPAQLHGRAGVKPRQGVSIGRLFRAAPRTPDPDADLKLTVQTAPGRRDTLFITRRSKLTIVGAGRSSRQVRPFLQPGVRVRINWTEIRDRSTAGMLGRRVDRLSISTERIEGRILRFDRNRILVSAVPKQQQKPDIVEPRRITVQGRRTPATPDEPEAKPPPGPRRLQLRWQAQATRLTIDGTEATAEALRDALSNGDPFRFEALVIADTRPLLVEFHAYSAEKPAENGNKKPPNRVKP